MAQQVNEAFDRNNRIIRRRKVEQDRLTIIRRFEVERRTGLSRSAIYRRISEGKFPPPVPLGGGDDSHAVGWVEAEIDEYLAKCVAARDQRVAR